MKIDKNKLIVILVGFLDILAIGIIIPTLPELGKYYGVPAHLIAYGVTFYALFAFLSGPILGQLSDKFGRKKILNLCVIGSFLSSLVIVFSPSFLWFLVGRIINGITGGNISILQAIIGDISKTKEDRAANLGILGAMFGMAFVVGPLIGGILLNFGTMVPYRFMVVLSFIEILIISVVFKESNHNLTSHKIQLNPFKSIFKALTTKHLGIYLVSFLIILLAIGVYQSIFSLYLSEEYALSGAATGYIMSAMGVIMILNQVFLLKKFWMKKFKLDTLLYIINFGLLAFFIVLLFVTKLPIFLIIFFLMVPIQGILNPVYQGEIIEHSDEKQRGEVMGVLGSLQSVSMFIGPLIGGFLLAHKLPIFGVSGIFMIISLIIVAKYLVKIEKKHD